MVAHKLQAVMTFNIEGAAFLVADEVPLVTTRKDGGDLEMAYAEMVPEGVGDKLTSAEMESICEVPVLTTPKDGGDLELANAEMVPEDVEDKLTIVGMESIVDEVWRCLEEEEEEEEKDDDHDDDVNDDDEDEYEEGGGGEVGIVGIYGMGGVGKTTLLKQIYNKLLDLQNKFGFVIWVSVSKDLRLEKIQEQIGIKIGLFDEVWRKIYRKLFSRLVLLKFVTSWKEADRQFKVKCLAAEEAWKLFQTLIGDETLHDGHPEVLGLARDVSKECYGLPLALVRIAQAMDGKQTPQEWRDSLQVFRRLRSSISGSDDQLKTDIYYPWKLSYDNLQNDLFKTCFLHCYLLPRNYGICKRDLIYCWIGERFLDDRLEAQSQGYYIISVLLSVCLLEEEEKDDNYVKMHNWIHDKSMWIISEIEKGRRNFFVCIKAGRNFFVCIKAGMTELPEIENWKNVIRMLVVDNSITDLKDAPTSPHLQTLFLNLIFSRLSVMTSSNLCVVLVF